MNITTIFVLILLFFGGLCISAGYMLTNAIHRLRAFRQKQKAHKEETA